MPPIPEFFLVRVGDGKRAIVWVTKRADGQVLVRLQLPPPNPEKEG